MMVSDALSILKINWHAMAARIDGTSVDKSKNIWRENLRNGGQKSEVR
jgi:hypothetical protein